MYWTKLAVLENCQFFRSKLYPGIKTLKDEQCLP